MINDNDAFQTEIMSNYKAISAKKIERVIKGLKILYKHITMLANEQADPFLMLVSVCLDEIIDILEND